MDTFPTKLLDFPTKLLDELEKAYNRAITDARNALYKNTVWYEFDFDRDPCGIIAVTFTGLRMDGRRVTRKAYAAIGQPGYTWQGNADFFVKQCLDAVEKPLFVWEEFEEGMFVREFEEPSVVLDFSLRQTPDKVITSGPCTHAFCNGKKIATVRKSESDRWNAEKGFAMVICKATYDKDTFEDLIKYAGKETVIAFAKYKMGIDGYLDLRRHGWKTY